MNIKTFVFLDSETTGLPSYECNKTKITELCLISVQAEHLSLGVVPRVQNKLNLCFNPRRRIQPTAEDITGLYNDLLEQESSFDETSIDLLLNFLERLSKPICFVAHNGHKFDYPILRTHIESGGKTLPNDFLCIDSLRAFRNILTPPDLEPVNLEPITLDCTVIDSTQENNFSDDWDEVLFNETLNIERSLENISPKSSKKYEQQKYNETTPPSKKPCNIPAAPKQWKFRPKTENEPSTSGRDPGARRQLNFNNTNIKKESFKLIDVYERLLQKQAENAHHAEYDVKMMLEIAVHLGEKFVNWANMYAISFNNTPKMQPGKPVGF